MGSIIFQQKCTLRFNVIQFGLSTKKKIRYVNRNGFFL